MACPPPRTAECLSWFHRRGSGSRRASLDIPTGIFHFRAQPSVSVLSGKQLVATDRQSKSAGAWTAFERPFSEPYRFEYGFRAGEFGDVESRVDL